MNLNGACEVLGVWDFFTVGSLTRLGARDGGGEMRNVVGPKEKMKVTRVAEYD